VTTKTKHVVLIATSSAGKLRDFTAAAAQHDVQIAPVPDFETLPIAREDAPTFEANACKKAEHYSHFVEDELVLADDSGLRVQALDGAPGVRSARYAADEKSATQDSHNSTDQANIDRLLREMKDTPDDRRKAKFICAIAVAKNGRTIAVFRGEVDGTLLHQTRGAGGFGYDPLFYIEEFQKTFAELTPEEKASISHRGKAFTKFLRWYQQQVST
jgi:XTP/dITP diphosphohydrolase